MQYLLYVAGILWWVYHVGLAGHQGNFKSGQRGTILKKFCARESEALEILMDDALKQFVPQYYGRFKDETGNGESSEI